MTEPRFKEVEGEFGPEYWEGDEKIAYINDKGTLQAAHGKADRKHEVIAFREWHAARVVKHVEETSEKTKDYAFDISEGVDPNKWEDGGIEVVPPAESVAEAFAVPIQAGIVEPVIPKHEHEEDLPPKPDPTTARFAFTDTDEPKAPLAPPTGPPEVPKTEPRLIPGLAYLAPDYLWWAWHQDDGIFQAIYKKTKAEFEKEHGGYLDKIRNRTVNGGMQ